MPKVPTSARKLRPFDQVVAIGNGLIDPRKPEFRDRLHVGPDNISSDSGRIVHPLQTGRELGLKSGKFPFEVGDILYSKIRPNLNKVAIADVRGICSADMYVLKPKGIDRSFLFHSLRDEFFYKQAVAASMRSGLPKVNRDDLSMMELRVPSLPAQRRTAAILDEWDSAIAAAEKLVEANRHRKNAIRDALFRSNLRLGNYSTEWNATPLANLLRVRGETSVGDETVYSVSVSRGLVDQVEHLGRSFSATNTDKYNRVCFGDVVYTKSPTGSFPLGVVKQSHVENDVIVSPLYGVYVPKSIPHGHLIDLYFSSPSAAEKYLAPFVHRGAKNTMAITDEGFLAGEIPMPPTQEEANVTGKFVEALNNEIDRLEDYCVHLRLQKRGLMQKLLSGDWPLPESIDRMLPGGHEAGGAEVQRAEATG